MIEYMPAFDTNHSSFRILNIFNLMEKDSIEIDRIKIMDFYLLFPKNILDISLPHKYLKIKNNLFNHAPGQYETNSNPLMIFSILDEIQNTSIAKLTALGIMDNAESKNGIAKIDNSQIPLKIITLINNHKYKNNPWVLSLLEMVLEMPLTGLKGLKFRTGLQEFKYER